MANLYAERAGNGYRVMSPLMPDAPPGEVLGPVIVDGNHVANILQVSQAQLPILLDRLRANNQPIEAVRPFSGLLEPLNDPDTRESIKSLMRQGGQITGEAAGALVQAIPDLLIRIPSVGPVLTTVGKTAGGKWMMSEAEDYLRRQRDEENSIRADSRMLNSEQYAKYQAAKKTGDAVEEINTIPDRLHRQRMAKALRDAEDNFSTPELRRAERAYEYRDIAEEALTATRESGITSAVGHGNWSDALALNLRDGESRRSQKYRDMQREIELARKYGEPR